MSSQERAEYHRNRHKIAKKDSHRQITLRLLDAIEDIGENEANEIQESIWFPHFLDYRGRMYPYPQDLHPQASDRVRACLEFAEGKPLGPDGKKWLKRQLSASHSREAAQQPNWVEDQEYPILRLADDPLNEIEFWEKASKPWRFLAACCEWAELHRQDGEFLSHIPVTMDGRCNGLQHLAALAGDPILGELVHITPSQGDASIDVYEVIADKLQPIVQRDAITGNHKDAALAWLKGDDLISRDTVKTAVMTFPFGVKLEGLKKQILKDDAVYNIPDGVPRRDANYLAIAITEITDEDRGGVLSQAKAIMDWLSGIAKKFARAQAAMAWTNPAGMKILLANYHYKSLEIALHGLRPKVSVTYRSEDKERGLDTQKQGQGITASLVHSFDAAHLAKTVNACVREGINSFAVIHDSYGTHACDAEAMARLLRKQFVEIYSQPWLKRLAERWRQSAGAPSGINVIDPPDQGNLDIGRVIDSETFFC